MRDKQQMAELWCLLNGWRLPDGTPAQTDEERAKVTRMWREVDRVAHDEGLALWGHRFRAGLRPETG